ncbi:MAG: hypothetical protein KatS3mg122_2023 [Caldimonas sp.]|nr:MAG: hypothetical protein KatS3mg122_2023 [Caldimonas sp.]
MSPPADLPSRHATAPAQAQGLRCGPWALAFPYSWARTFVEDIELSEVPHAPAWLLGAANVDGSVVPVFDLLRWLDPAQGTPTGPGSRMLLGGDGDQVACLIFRGLPTPVHPVAGAAPGVPPALAEFVRGAAVDAQGQPWAVIDAAALLEAWAAELSLA